MPVGVLMLPLGVWWALQEGCVRVGGGGHSMLEGEHRAAKGCVAVPAGP